MKLFTSSLGSDVCLSIFLPHSSPSKQLLPADKTIGAMQSLAQVLAVLLLGFQSSTAYSFVGSVKCVRFFHGVVSCRSKRSFPIAKETARSSTQLYVDQAIDIDKTPDFWGKARSKEEIVRFVSDVVFNDFHETYDDSQAKNELCQWVEVISAEPPVRRSDFSLRYKFNLVLSLLAKQMSAAGHPRIFGTHLLRSNR